MSIRKFVIKNYRAITGPLVIDLERDGLLPIIGVNESGKTTILHAIFAFDHFNDKLNENGRHLKDITNLYETAPSSPEITAEVDVTYDEYLEWLAEAKVTDTLLDALEEYKAIERDEFPDFLTITRDLAAKTYDILHPRFSNKVLNDVLGRDFIRHLPFILFFDDFRDSVEERIEIKKGPRDEVDGWLSIMERLFNHTDKSFTVFELADKEERQRKTILARVRRALNETLTREWQNFRLDDTHALQISIDYEEEAGTDGSIRKYLRLEVIETDAAGDEHYFFIRDRSKGFFWFFNFVMKLEFNPKVVNNSRYDSIYLLDEPGSYLHAFAQRKLCVKLQQLSRTNRVVYCTHSHYLLDPEIIPLNSINVADRTPNGSIELVPIHEHNGSILDRRSAFQPVLDALEIKPFLLDLTQGKVIITEGIVDYYALQMFKGARTAIVLPSVGADSIKFYISLMIAWRVQYSALWDNDEAGRAAKKQAVDYFGANEAKQRFFVLPLTGPRAKRRILQDLFAGEDLQMIKATLGLPKRSSFAKAIASLFYSPKRETILNQISRATRDNFDHLFTILNTG